MSNLFHSQPAACRALATALFAIATGAAAEDGITASEVFVGTSNALTGPLAVCGGVTAGANAYLKVVNDRGGVNGRKIRYEVLDDAYSTQRAIGNVRRLISQDKAFALLSGCGTATGAAILNAIERENIPYLFPFVGLDALSQPPKKNVFSLLPLYGVQLTTMLDYVAKNRSDIKTAAVSMVTIAGHEAWAQLVRAKLTALGIKGQQP